MTDRVAIRCGAGVIGHVKTRTDESGDAAPSETGMALFMEMLIVLTDPNGKGLPVSEMVTRRCIGAGPHHEIK